MNPDELQDARDHVVAEHSRRERLREDWGYYREPEEVLYEAVVELEAERDRLRAVVDALRDWQQAETQGRQDEAQGLCRDTLALLRQLDVSPTIGGTES